MKRILCPKCDKQLTFDDTKYPDRRELAFVCPQCGTQFKVKKPDFSFGRITVIENSFGYKQEFPLVLGDNVIGRRNKDTEGVDIPIITNDPSMGRKHCVINVKKNKQGKLIYTLRDFPSLTGTFLRNELLADKDQIRIDDEEVVTIGATTFILKTRK